MADPRASRKLVSAAEWDNYRPIITDLYQNQNKTLKTVMQIMRDEYQFMATTKMYKSRFEQWGLQKNIKSKQVGELLRQKTARDAVGKPAALYIRGKKVPEEKLRAYIQRTSNINQIWLSAISPGTSAPPNTQDDIACKILCRTPSPVLLPHDTSSLSSKPPLSREASNPKADTKGFSALRDTQRPPSATADRVRTVTGKVRRASQDRSSSGPGYFSSSAVDRCEVFIKPGPSNCRQRTPKPFISHLMPLAAPKSLAVPEECMHILRDYVSGNFAFGLWNRAKSPFDRDNEQVIDWHDQINTATGLLRSGNSQEAFHQINISLDKYGDILRAQNFKLFIYTYYIIVKSVREFPEVVKAILQHACGLSQIIHQSCHPLHRIMKKMCDMDAMELYRASRYLLECYIDFIEEHLDPASDFLMILTMARCSTTKCLEFNGLYDKQAAKASLKGSLAKMKQRNGPTSVGVFSATVYLAYTYYQNGELLEARRLVQYMTDTSQPQPDRYILSSVYPLLFRISCINDTHEEAIQSGQNWIKFSRREFGGSHFRTLSAIAAFKEYLKEISLEPAGEVCSYLDPTMGMVAGNVVDNHTQLNVVESKKEFG